ncbi:MAG: flagellar protein FlgN [Acidimicrobiales bacterium]
MTAAETFDGLKCGSRSADRSLVDLADISTILWRERQMLEQLLFKMTVEHLVLSTGDTRWLPKATEEVELVLESIGRAELLRAMAVREVGERLGLGAAPTLRELIPQAPAPWDAVLQEHRNAFLELTAEIEEMARTNRELIQRGAMAVRQLLESLGAAEPDALSRRPERRPTGTMINEVF